MNHRYLATPLTVIYYCSILTIDQKYQVELKLLVGKKNLLYYRDQSHRCLLVTSNKKNS